MYWEIALLMLSDAMVYLTYPIHIRFFYVLLRKNNQELDPSFQILLTNLTFFNILFASSYAFIQEPAAHGLCPDFYAEMAPVFGRIELIKATVLAFCMSFDVLIALNRLTAFALPLKQTWIWSPRNTRIACSVVWATVAITSLPILIGPSTSFRIKQNFFHIPSVEYVFTTEFNVYPVITMLFTGACEICNLIIYSCIVMFINRFKFFKIAQIFPAQLGTQRKFSKNVHRMAFAAAVNSLGGWVIFLFFLSYYVYQWSTGMKMVDFTTYSLILRLIVAFNNMLTPWVMLAAFKSIRDLFFRRKTAYIKPPSGNTQDK